MTAAKVLCAIVIVLTGVHFAVAIGTVGLGQGAGLDTFLAGYFADPWQAVIDIDLMAGLLLAAGWIWWREPDRGVAIAWLAPLFWWGNLVVAIYAWRAIDRSEGEWPRFFGGGRAGGAASVAAESQCAGVRSSGLRVLCLLGVVAAVSAILLLSRAKDFALLPSIGYACGLGCFIPALIAGARK